MKKIILCAAALLLPFLLIGCSAQADAGAGECEGYDDGLVIVVGVHANQPAPNVPATLACSIEKTIAGGGSIGVIASDGEPTVLVPAQAFEVDGNNPATTRNNTIAAINLVIGSIQQAKPRVAGSNLYAALTLAADLARTATPVISTVVVIDAGLPDRGAVDLTVDGGTLVSSEQLVEHLTTAGALRDDTFAGLRFDFWGLGYTSRPQEPLANSQTNNITRLWPALVVAGGGTSTAVPLPREGDPVDTTLETGVVEVIEPPVLDVASGTVLTFDSTSALAFASGASELLDSSAATTALAPVVTWLTEEAGRTATITGRTDSDQPELNGPLSLARATTVADLLVSLGVSRDALSIVGAAYTASPPDRLVDGSLDPYAAALNRVTEIALAGR